MPGSIDVGISDKETVQKLAWSRVYTPEEMARLDAMLTAAERASAGDSTASGRVANLREWLFNVMKTERGAVMGKEDIRRALTAEAASTRAKAFPAPAEWKNAKEYSLVPAERMNPKLKAAGKFRMLASKERLFIRAEFSEPDIAKTSTDGKRRSGDPEIWKDNCVELFFYSMKTKKFWHIIVNDSGAWSSRMKGRVLLKWVQMPGLTAKAIRSAEGWTAGISIPLAELKTEGGELRFNLTRERNCKGSATELSTWSPLAKAGSWFNYENYGTAEFK